MEAWKRRAARLVDHRVAEVTSYGRFALYQHGRFVAAYDEPGGAVDAAELLAIGGDVEIRYLDVRVCVRAPQEQDDGRPSRARSCDVRRHAFQARRIDR